MTGFQCYCIFTSLKLHFTSKQYDFFKYGGKTKLKQSNYDIRKDRFFFDKLSKRYSIKEDLIEFLVSNFLIKDSIWVGNLLDAEADAANLKRKKTIQSLSYIFKSDCEKIFSDVENPNTVLTVNDGYPSLLTNWIYDEISLETLCVLNKILGFLPMWESKITDDIVWPTYMMKIEKYSPFIQIDLDKYREILKCVVFG
jgi:hypothetical protein